MNFRELMNKIAEAEEAAAPAQAVWTPSPEQAKWIGGANQQDPYILSRMPGQKPPISWFKDPADQELAKRMGFPTAVPPAPAAVAAAQGAADDQSLASAREKLKQLMTLLAKAKASGAPQAVKEAIDAEIARQLIESFGYTQDQLDELSWEDVGDFGRGAWQGATLGTGSNIAAGAKSLFKGTKYKDELAKELAADKAAQERSPYAYGAGNVGGAIGSSFAIPGAGLGNLAARQAAKLGAGAATQAVTKGAAMVGTNLALQKGIDTAVSAHNQDVLGTTDKAGATPGATKPDAAGAAKPGASKPADAKLQQLQKMIGATPDGIYGPETKAKLQAWQQSQGIAVDGIPGPETYGKAGIKESAVEQYARLRDRLAMLETEQQTDEGVWDSLASGASKLVKGVGQGFKNPGVRNLPNLATAQRVGANIGTAGNKAAKVATKTGAAVTGAAKTAGGAIARNPGKTALGTAAAGYGLSQLGGEPGQAPAKPGATKPGSGGGAAAAGTTSGLDQATLDQINQLMSELAQYDIPEIQQGLVKARQELSQITGDKNIGSADKPQAAPAPAAAAPVAKPELTPQQQAQNVLQPGMNK